MGASSPAGYDPSMNPQQTYAAYQGLDPAQQQGYVDQYMGLDPGAQQQWLYATGQQDPTGGMNNPQFQSWFDEQLNQGIAPGLTYQSPDTSNVMVPTDPAALYAQYQALPPQAQQAYINRYMQLSPEEQAQWRKAFGQPDPAAPPPAGGGVGGTAGGYPTSWVDIYNQQSPEVQKALADRYQGWAPERIQADFAALESQYGSDPTYQALKAAGFGQNLATPPNPGLTGAQAGMDRFGASGLPGFRVDPNQPGWGQAITGPATATPGSRGSLSALSYVNPLTQPGSPYGGPNAFSSPYVGPVYQSKPDWIPDYEWQIMQSQPQLTTGQYNQIGERIPGT